MIALDLLLELTASRWAIPVIAAIAEHDGARFAGLLHRIGAPRSVLAATLADLSERGLVARNPGHGHPLRPEYLLTERGAGLAAWCATVEQARQSLALPPPALGRWGMPVVSTLATAPARFGQLQKALPISPRALSQSLDRLAENRLIIPEAAPYALSRRGNVLGAALSAPCPSAR